MNQLYRIVYCSRNAIPASEEDLAGEVDRILDVSRRNNARQGITGSLLYTQGCFAQALEGPADVVEQAFERIQCDERHYDVTVLQAGPAGERAFGTWSMGFAGTDAMPGLDGAELHRAFESQGAVGNQVLDMLRSVVMQG